MRCFPRSRTQLYPKRTLGAAANRGMDFAPDFCTKIPQQNQHPAYGAEILIFAPSADWGAPLRSLRVASAARFMSSLIAAGGP
jgi:hypothetical protein